MITCNGTVSSSGAAWSCAVYIQFQMLTGYWISPRWLTSPTSGGRSVGIVRWRTKAPEFFCQFVRCHGLWEKQGEPRGVRACIQGVSKVNGKTSGTDSSYREEKKSVWQHIYIYVYVRPEHAEESALHCTALGNNFIVHFQCILNVLDISTFCDFLRMFRYYGYYKLYEVYVLVVTV
jgi:hypothetical protein